MRLPAGRRDDLVDGGAVGTVEQADEERLLGALARPPQSGPCPALSGLTADAALLPRRG